MTEKGNTLTSVWGAEESRTFWGPELPNYSNEI